MKSFELVICNDDIIHVCIYMHVQEFIVGISFMPSWMYCTDIVNNFAYLLFHVYVNARACDSF